MICQFPPIVSTTICLDSVSSVFNLSHEPLIILVTSKNILPICRIMVDTLYSPQTPSSILSPSSTVISTTGISGNATVTNIAGDSITHIYNSTGTDNCITLATIEERLKIVHDRDMGWSSLALRCTCFLNPYSDISIHRWLASPDFSSNYNTARRKHQLNTGSWFLNGKEYAKWKEDPRAFLSIYGKREAVLRNKYKYN